MYRPKNEIRYAAKKLLIEAFKERGHVLTPSGPNRFRLELTDSRCTTATNYHGLVVTLPKCEIGVCLDYEEKDASWEVTANSFSGSHGDFYLSAIGHGPWKDFKVSVGEPDFDKKIVQTTLEQTKARATYYFDLYQRCWWIQKALAEVDFYRSIHLAWIEAEGLTRDGVRSRELLAVLKADHIPSREMHIRFVNGGFELVRALIRETDFVKLVDGKELRSNSDPWFLGGGLILSARVDMSYAHKLGRKVPLNIESLKLLGQEIYDAVVEADTAAGAHLASVKVTSRAP